MLWTLVPQATRDQLTKDKAPVIDCVRAVSKWNVLLVWAYITKSSDVTLRLLSRLRNYSGPVVLFYGICICVIIDHHEGRCYVTHSQIMINVKKTHFLQSLNSRAQWTSGSTQSWQKTFCLWNTAYIERPLESTIVIWTSRHQKGVFLGIFLHWDSHMVRDDPKLVWLIKNQLAKFTMFYT